MENFRYLIIIRISPAGFSGILWGFWDRLRVQMRRAPKHVTIGQFKLQNTPLGIGRGQTTSGLCTLSKYADIKSSMSSPALKIYYLYASQLQHNWRGQDDRSWETRRRAVATHWPIPYVASTPLVNFSPIGQFFPNWSIPHTIDQFECF